MTDNIKAQLKSNTFYIIKMALKFKSLKQIGYIFFLIIPSLLLLSCSKETQVVQEPTRDIDIKIPHIHIKIGDSSEIDSKDYKAAQIFIDSKGGFKDIQVSGKVAGRGNYSWSLPKKPYKIKFDNAQSIFGLPAYKKWVLLAEYMDGSMLYNSIPFGTAYLLKLPYSNHIFPVDVTINGQYRGLYILTESLEVGKGRIDIGEDGTLLELDSYYDEKWKFISGKFKLPVMVKYPEEEDMTEEKLTEIKGDFEALEKLIYATDFPNNNYLDLFHDTAFVDYMIVYQLSANFEINHPKSTYMNKKSNGKYKMGVIWDFDWAMGYNDITGIHYDPAYATSPLIYENGNNPGTKFFGRIMQDPKIQKLFLHRWKWFRQHKYQSLRKFVSDYSLLINESYKEDHNLWGLRGSTGVLASDLQRALSWLDARADYIDDYADSLNQ